MAIKGGAKQMGTCARKIKKKEVKKITKNKKIQGKLLRVNKVTII